MRCCDVVGHAEVGHCQVTLLNESLQGRWGQRGMAGTPGLLVTSSQKSSPSRHRAAVNAGLGSVLALRMACLMVVLQARQGTEG